MSEPPDKTTDVTLVYHGRSINSAYTQLSDDLRKGRLPPNYDVNAPRKPRSRRSSSRYGAKCCRSHVPNLLQLLYSRLRLSR